MNNVDFLPERIRQSRISHNRMVRRVYMLIVCAAALVALGHFRQEQISAAKADFHQIVQRSESVELQLSHRDELLRQQAELFIIQRIEAHLGSRSDALELLAEVEKLLPPSAALAQLEVMTTDVTVPVKSAGNTSRSAGATAAPSIGPAEKMTIKRVQLKLTGLAPNDVDVANFILQMAASELFEDVDMGYSRDVEIQGRKARQFQASCYVVR